MVEALLGYLGKKTWENGTMLEVVKFANGRYGLRNTWTGLVLKHSDGTVRQYRKPRGALRGLSRLERGFSRSIKPTVKQTKIKENRTR
jgi:hypothetical protein